MPACRAVGASCYVGAGGFPPNLGLAPSKYFSIWCKKEHSMAFKIRQNAFPAGAPPTPLGSLRRSPRPLVGWGGDTPAGEGTALPIPYPTRRLRRLNSPAFGAHRHSAPRFGGWGNAPNYFPLEPRLNNVSIVSSVCSQLFGPIRGFTAFACSHHLQFVLTRALQPVATCRQSPYLHKPAIIIMTSFSL